mgnify:CR=1 FL=1
MNVTVFNFRSRFYQARSFVAFFCCFVLSSTLNARTLIFQAEPEAPANQGVSTKVLSTPKASTAAQSKRKVAEVVVSAVTPTSGSASSELFFMIERLQQEVNQLRGLLEEQSNEIRHIKRNAKSRYRDIDSRVLGLSKKLSAAVPQTVMSAVPGAIAPGAAIVPVSDKPVLPKQGAVALNTAVKGKQKVIIPTASEKKAYQQAYALIKEKKFDMAVKRFYQFIEQYPDGAYVGNAYYWLGEVYLVLPQLEQAKQAFSIVVDAYPEHSKAADALFKLGVTYDRLQDPATSEKYLMDVQKKFPDSTAAKLAKSYKINR